MSSLGLSLLILALVGVGGVLLYNYWLGGSFRRRVPDGREPEPLLRQEPRFGRVGPASIEPMPGEDFAARDADGDGPPVLSPDDAVGDGPDAAPVQPAADAAGRAPAAGTTPAAAPSQAAEGAVISAQDRILEAQAARAGPPAPRLDPVADCCVAVELTGPVAGERIISLARRFRRAGSKPVLVEGSTQANAWMVDEPPVPAGTGATDEGGEAGTHARPEGDGPAGDSPGVEGEVAVDAQARTDPDPDFAGDAGPDADAGVTPVTAAAAATWESPAPGRHYRSLRVGILMANRHGPLNAMEYSEFVTGLQALADSLGAFVEPPDMMRVLERARGLDARCAALDAQIGVNVEVSEALSPADLNGIAQSADVIERGNNRYARLGDQGEVVFSVALGDTPNRLTFLLDVPRVAAEREPLREMVACAWHCAQALQGRMVDDTGRALTDAVFTRIEAQLAARYDALEAAGFRAGSPVALRLFN